MLMAATSWMVSFGNTQLNRSLPTVLIDKIRPKDLRRLRRYRRRWKIERLFAWLQNFRRLVVRYERYAENFLGMLHLGCCLILLRHIILRWLVISGWQCFLLNCWLRRPIEITLCFGPHF